MTEKEFEKADKELEKSMREWRKQYKKEAKEKLLNNPYLKILKKIKKTKQKDLKKIAEKLEDFTQIKETPISFNDFEEAYRHEIEGIRYCSFHQKGGMLESLGWIECPCGCRCQNCEFIPQSEVGIRMQELGFNITEENVMFEFLEKHPNFNLIIEDSNAKERIGEIPTPHDSNNTGSDC